MRSLPPFDALVAFDAALRQGSMTSAAAELGMTQSAVSHRVRRLEAFMGASLLNRTATGLTTTPAGAALASGLTGLLDDLGDLRARCRAILAPASLRVGIAAGLADYWLVRRLPGFTAAHPGQSVELVIAGNDTAARASDVDVRIHWVPVGAVRGASTQRLLFQEKVFPVCRPDLLPGGAIPDDPKALARLPLLHKGVAGSGMEWSWPVWFERLGLEGPPTPVLRFDSLGTAIAAALQGAGVVLARSLLVHDALAEGRLVRVLPPSWDMVSTKAHVVRWPGALAGDARVERFVAWLVVEAAATGARV